MKRIPPSPEYKDGFYAAIDQARACIQRELSANNITKEKPNDPDISARTMLLSVDTAIQQEQPR